MIRYPVTRQALEAFIDAEEPTWRQRAADRTADFRRKAAYDEKTSIWSEVKVVYMRLQYEKCAYCERLMSAERYGKVAQDVEHFRPKGNVRAWKVPASMAKLGIKVTPPSAGAGYHLLPYHPFNYAAACKPCNSSLKKDYFPIAGTYRLSADDPARLAAEKAYLIYPIGDLDEDPEKLIDFHGPLPRPIARTGWKRRRALMNIEFFKLDAAEERKDLYRDRAILIIALHPLLLETTQGTARDKAKSKQSLARMLNPGLAHLNCARSFQRLFQRDPAEARAVYEAARKLMETIS